MDKIISKYSKAIDSKELSLKVSEISSISKQLYNAKNLAKLFGLIDLTTLKETDTHAVVSSIVNKVNHFHEKFDVQEIPNVAAICVYPPFVETINKERATKKIKIASVVGAFPSSQTFIEIKEAECKAVVKQGADEADMVISIGKFLDGNYETVFNEIVALKKAVGKAQLKVIIESGVLKTPQNIKTASILAMEAGADFIKTSTGKTTPAATLEAAYIMTQAIAEYFQKSGRMVGFKPAGGIASGMEAIKYLAIIKHNLGDSWFVPKYFRIGTSSLANNILTEINQLKGVEPAKVDYF
jgi:deoxyribose-phosphate aldolase